MTRPVDGVEAGDTLYPGDVIGHTPSSNACWNEHLHFQENIGWLNPLRGGGLDPYTDSDAPVTESLRVVRYDNNVQILDTLWGKVDLVAKAWDSHDGPGIIDLTWNQFQRRRQSGKNSLS